VRIGDVVLRNRVVTASSLLGYGVANSPLVPYGMSPVSLFVPLSEFGAVTTRTLTVEPREGHFTTRDRWPLRELPGLLRRYDTVLRRTDAGFVNAFGWCNVGIDAYLSDYYPRTRDQWTIISLGGFSAEEFVTLVDRVNSAVPAGDIAAVELNVSCHNVNFDFSTIVADVLDEAVPRSNHPVLLKLSPDYDYLRNAAQAVRAGVAGLTAINTVKALRLDPRTGQPLLANRFGGLSGRAVKPIGLRVVAELRDAGISLPIVAAGGIRTVDDCREYFWAGADAVSLGVLLGRRRRGEPGQRHLARQLSRLRPRPAARTGGAAAAADTRRSRSATAPYRPVARSCTRCDDRRRRGLIPIRSA
jgi:dihydroorotate dehydrogenase (NAD+) catalytic subunit